MQYVGHEGIIAAWYSVIHGCLPEIAFYKAFGEQVPQKLRYKIVLEVDKVDVSDKHLLVGLPTKQRFWEYRSKAQKEAANEL